MLANFFKVHERLKDVGDLPHLGNIYRPQWELGEDEDEGDEEDEKIQVEIEVPVNDSDEKDASNASSTTSNGSKDPTEKKKTRKVKVPKQFEVKCAECQLPNVSDYEWGCECPCNDDDEPETKYPPTKKTLKKIQDDLEHLACGLGSGNTFAMKRVFTNGTTGTGTNSSAGSILDFVHVNGEPLPKDPDTLWAMGKQSAYGDLKTMKTTFDTNVRNAREISLPKSNSSSPSDLFNASSDAIKSIELTQQAKNLLNESVREISEKMFGGQELGYEINKINLYGPGGHFKEHIDTPRDGVVGSLVVRLPYLYDGGRFSIRFSTEEASGTALARVAEEHSTYNKSISLIAFYCECPHKIDRVTAGMRVTVTFYLTQRPATASSPSSSSLPTAAMASPTLTLLTSGVVESKEEKVDKTSAPSNSGNANNLSGILIDTDKSLHEWEEVDSELVKKAAAASPAEATNGSVDDDSTSSDAGKISSKRKNPFAETGADDLDDEDDDEDDSAATCRKRTKNNRSSASETDSNKWQYFVHRSKSVDNLRNSGPDDLLKLVTDYFACLKVLKEPSRPIGIFLSHPYSAEQFLAKTFKGADVAFMRKIGDLNVASNSSNASSKFTAFNIPVVIRQSESRDGDDSENSHRSISVHSLLDIDLQDARGNSGKVDDDDEDDDCRNIIFFGKNWKEVSRQYDPGAEHAGNESRDSSLMAKYFANAVIFIEKSDSNADNLANFTAFVKKPLPKQLVLDV